MNSSAIGATEDVLSRRPAQRAPGSGGRGVAFQPPSKPAAPTRVTVRPPITLGQFLKVANFASSGGEAKMMVAVGAVRVNGETEQRRGRKLVPGDLVRVNNATAQVAVEAPPAETPV